MVAPAWKWQGEPIEQQIGVACPFCMIMLEDARGAAGAESLLIRDVAELVADALAVESPLTQ